MKVQLLTMGIAALTLSGCAGSYVPGGYGVKVYPVEGPIAAANPGLVIKATSVGRGNDGHISFALPEGATCDGQWKITKQAPRRGKKPNSNQPGGNEWTSTYRYTAAEGAGTGLCTNGATFEMAFRADGEKGGGAARDSNGNVYRIAYR